MICMVDGGEGEFERYNMYRNRGISSCFGFQYIHYLIIQKIWISALIGRDSGEVSLELPQE